MCSLVSSSTTLPLLLVKISQISLLWLLLQPEEDQMRGTHVNQDMMWHIVKRASIMHTASSWGCASPNSSYFSLLLSHGYDGSISLSSLTDRQEQGKHEKWTDEMTGCSQVYCHRRFYIPVFNECMTFRTGTAANSKRNCVICSLFTGMLP